MIHFKGVELSDRAWMEPLIQAGNLRGCEHGFANAFIWDGAYHHQVAQLNQYLVARVGQYFYFPTGSGPLPPVVEQMMAHARGENAPFAMVGVTLDQQAALDRAFPNTFRYTADRNGFDYLYRTQALSTLAGKKLQPKRNHIHRFEANNPDWQFEPIAPRNLDECRQMSRQWFQLADADAHSSLLPETIALQACFDHYDALGLDGGLIRAGRKVIAFTLGTQLCADTFDIHIEKAFVNIQGAYPIINREFAKYIQQKYPHILFINREDDLGSEGIRRSKLSYHPEILLEKHICELK